MHLEMRKKRMKIMFVHLLNNYTGSPRVLSNILSYLITNTNHCLTLLTSDSSGCLSDIEGVNYVDNKYRWKNSIISRIFSILISQIYQFFFVLFGKKNDVYYINTILPFGAALAAYIRKCRIIYHIHEVYIHPSVFQKVCLYVLKITASKIIVVSEYVKNFYQAKMDKELVVICNTVSKEIFDEGFELRGNEEYMKSKFCNKLILMPSGLKKYKGIDVFVELAKRMPAYNFKLVLSCERGEAMKYFKETELPPNLEFNYQVISMIELYKEASIVVNLTLPDLCIETFGMVLLEGACFSTPSIAPNIGGPVEIVTGSNGFLINPYEIEDIEEKIHLLLDNMNVYMEYSTQAFITTEKFIPDVLLKRIRMIIENKGR